MEGHSEQIDLGATAEAEERQNQENTVKQPKKRFVGRRAAAEAAKSSSGAAAIEDSGAIQGTGCSVSPAKETKADPYHSRPAKESAEDSQPNTARDS
jgi:hypothetical protein